MKKLKVVKPYSFKDQSHQDVSDQLDKSNPINIKYNEDLVNRIHTKYPIVTKVEIAIVVSGVFKSIRELLILGKILNFNKLFFDTKLHFFGYRKGNHILPSLKVKVGTPPPLRKL